MMNPSHASLSSWPIDLAEIFSSGGLSNTTEEHLSRLESFINAYVLFDKTFIPGKYQHSSFIRSLDPNCTIFVCDCRITGSYKATSDGRTVIDVNPALLYKNGKHLKAKADGWLEQHIVFDLPKKERRDVIGQVGARSGLTRWFHQILLAEFQDLFDLSVANDAFSVAFASVCQTYLTDIAELPQFAIFLEKAIRKSGASVQRGEAAGIFNFELSTGGIEGHIKIPIFFDMFIERLERESFISALENLRRQCGPLRDAFRKVADAFLKQDGGALVSSRMTGTEIEEWNCHVDRNLEASDKALLLKSEVVAVELHIGLEQAELRRTLHDRIKACASLLRFIPPQAYSPYSRLPERLRNLKVSNVIRFKRRLFRIGVHSNKRAALHRGVASIVSYDISAGVQLTQAALNDSAIRDFGEEALPHLYMVCTRPRITVNPEIVIEQDQIKIEFVFQHLTHTECARLSLPNSGVRSVSVDESTHTNVVFKGHLGETTLWHAPLLYQAAVKSTIPEDTTFPLFDHISLENFSSEQTNALKHSDLEIIYIGQSKGRDLDRTAVMRLGNHEKWDVFYRHVAEENPHLEIWIVLLSLPSSHSLNMTIPTMYGNDHDMEELMHRVRNPSQVNPADTINFVEAALISHFKPRYNDKFKKGAFPSRKHESYERIFITPMDVAAIQMETWTSLGCRLYTKAVPPRFVHLKTCQLSNSFDMTLFRRKA